jgi:hypothetical protein
VVELKGDVTVEGAYTALWPVRLIGWLMAVGGPGVGLTVAFVTREDSEQLKPNLAPLIAGLVVGIVGGVLTGIDDSAEVELLVDE